MMTVIRTSRWLVASVLVFLAISSPAASNISPAEASAPVAFDAAADFSATANPNGAWSYGFIPVGGALADLTLYDEVLQFDGLDRWVHSSRPSGALAPTIVHNGTDAPITVHGDVTLGPGQLTFHPGPEGQESVVRFTAPSGGEYQIDATFAVGDPPDGGSTTTDVHVRKNGVALFDGDINASASATDSEHYLASLTLTAGDVVDFAVGFGNGNFFYDTTLLEAAISTTSPLAGTWQWVDTTSAGQEFSGAATIFDFTSFGPPQPFAWAWVDQNGSGWGMTGPDATMVGNQISVGARTNDRALSATWNGTVAADGQSISGTWTQSDGQFGTFVATRLPDALQFVSDSDWKFSRTSAPTWEQPGFNDSAWGSTVGSSAGRCGSYEGVMWAPDPVSGETIFVRRTFTLPSTPTDALLSIEFDDDGAVYVNGTLVHSNNDGFASGFRSVSIEGLLHSGDNVIAIQATDTAGGCQSIGVSVGIIGASLPPDSDGDGVPDESDQCPGTPPGQAVDATGCPVVPCGGVTVDNSLGNDVVRGRVLTAGCETRLRIANRTHLWGEIAVTTDHGVAVEPFGGLTIGSLGLIPPSKPLLRQVFGDSALTYDAIFTSGNSQHAEFFVNTFSGKAIAVNWVDLVFSSLAVGDVAVLVQAIQTSSSFINDLGELTHLQNALGFISNCEGLAARCLLRAGRELARSFTSPEELAAWVDLFADLGFDVAEQAFEKVSGVGVVLKWAGAVKSSHFQQPAGSVQFISHP